MTDDKGSHGLIQWHGTTIIGVRKGGLSATAGFNWADGGASDNMHGGQLVVRYTW